MPALFLGLMSGTSQDGIDAVLVEFSGQKFHRLVATHTQRYPAPLRRRLLGLARHLEPLTPGDLAALDRAVASAFARAALGVLRKARVSARRIDAIGSHGQTVFHAPHGRSGTTLQLGDPNVIAAATGITTVADFRRRDMAHGGQGAPLVPAFHRVLFAARRERRCVVNLGGIANITVLPDDREAGVTGFDSGPGNGLLDEWAQARLRRPYDDRGRWAASGEPDESLLRALLADPYFRRRPPKSTGRDHFNLDWARRRAPALDTLAAADVQATFAELTAASVTGAVERFAPRTQRVLVCGGGAKNRFLMQRLRMRLGPRRVETTDAHGLDARWIEAAAFAWLAMRTIKGLPGNLPAVTGASKAAVLGGIYSR